MTSTRISCSFYRPKIVTHKGHVHIDFSSENIASQTGPFSAVLERCHIHSVNSSVFRDKESGKPQYWVSVHIRYELKGGGENGVELGTATYCDGEWEFTGVLQARQCEEHRNSISPSSLF